MAAPCYEQYDHPLLWCEAKRRTEERRNAVETLEVVQQKKEREHFKKIQEANEVSELTCASGCLVYVGVQSLCKDISGIRFVM